ncbi:MAG: transposase [Thermomicrobiales bacterium]
MDRRMYPDRQRKPTRLREYDYRTPALYHVVMCTHHRTCRFGTIEHNAMEINEAGVMISDVWTAIPAHFPRVSLDAFVVMPNHVHGIIWIEPDEFETAPSLGDVAKWFKSVTVSRYSQGVHQRGWPPYDAHLWQRNYYDHIVRDDRDLDRIRLYIEHNPSTWANDDLHIP